MPNNGMPSNGMPNNGMPNNGMPSNGMPSNGMPNNGMPNNGMPSNGMPNNGMPNNGMPSNGMPSGMPSVGSGNRQPETIYFCETTIDGNIVTNAGKCMTNNSGETIGKTLAVCRSFMYDNNNNEVSNDKPGECPEKFTNLKSLKFEEHFESNKNLKCKHSY
jgi:hypothetical protein